MKVSALWLLVAAAVATLAETAGAEATGAVASTAAESLAQLQRFVDAALAERAQAAQGGAARRLMSVSAFEVHTVRHLSALAADADEETLQAEAEAIFKLYERLYPDLVATWGATADEQFAYFYANTFPKLLAKARKQASSTSGTSSSSTTTKPSTSSSSSTTTPSTSTSSSTGTSSTGTSSSGTSSTGTSSTGTSSTGTSSTGTSGTSSTGTTSSGTTSSGTTSSGTASSGTTSSGTASSGTASSGSSVSSALYAVASSSSVVEVSSSLSFFSNVYDTSLASDILALQDNTNNIETVVASASGSSSTGSSSSSSTGASTYTSPIILEGVDPTTAGRWRRMLGETTSGSGSSSATSVDVLFCDVTGNAIWKWSAEDIPLVTATNTSSTTTTINVEADGVCSSTTTTLSVSAYQSGCSLQNHPEGCGSVYYKGCGGMTVSPSSDKIVVARTGGRTLGVLSYVSVDGSCQGQVVDAISTYRGRKFNSPTFAEFSNKDILYFTDTPFGLATSADDFDSDALDTSPLREIPFNGVYMLRNGSNQSVELVDCDMDRPNKIAFSPSQEKMYITNSRASNSYVKEYTLADDGSVNSSRVFFNFTAFPELDTDGGYASGIKTDDTGNVYVVVSKSVFIFTPNATLVGSVVSNQVLDSVALGVGRMFITGGFGVVAQSSGVEPSQAIAQAKTTCDAR